MAKHLNENMVLIQDELDWILMWINKFQLNTYTVQSN